MQKSKKKFFERLCEYTLKGEFPQLIVFVCNHDNIMLFMSAHLLQAYLYLLTVLQN